MKKVIKIGFPILCVAVIGGTFFLLNKTTSKINRNRLSEDDEEIIVANNVIEENGNLEEVQENILSPEEVKEQEVKNKAKAIEIVKKLAPPTENTYYTNEGMVGSEYLVAIRDNETKDAQIYYTVNIGSEKIEIYVK